MALNLMCTIPRTQKHCRRLYQNIRLLTAERQLTTTNLPRQLFEKQVSKQAQFTSLCIKRFYSIQANQKDPEKDAEDYRNENNITILGKDIPHPYTNIEESAFPDYIKNFLQKQGFTKPTIIQAQGWPVALSGKNFVGIAQTGTGKTLAYLLPAVVHIKEKQHRTGRGPVALVLAPTRELARQIEQVAKDFERLLNIRCACIYGGASRNVQANQLQRGVDIVIATPGRLNDFINTKQTSLHRCTFVVLDEADKMLDMGFEPQIREVLEEVPAERQILMFSATWPMEVRSLAKDYLKEYVQVNVGSTELSANHNIKQHLYIVDMAEKMEKLKSIMTDIMANEPGKILVFTNTKRSVDYITQALSRNGWHAMGIHGDKTQAQRDMVINKFKHGRPNILVATDVAARGLDVDGVTHVINYDFPQICEDYIHRIGRTGRSENKGESHTLFTEEDGRLAWGLVEVLKEANQEVPNELYDLAANYDENKMEEKRARTQAKRQQYNKGYGSNKYNKFRPRSNSRSKYSLRDDDGFSPY